MGVATLKTIVICKINLKKEKKKSHILVLSSNLNQ